MSLHEVARDAVQQRERDLGVLDEVEVLEPGTHLRVGRVVEDDDRLPARVGAEQRGTVATHGLARVRGVDEGEVDVAALAPELGQHLRQELGGVADVEGHVVELAGQLRHVRVEVEGMDVLGVGGDPPQAAALEGPDLDRQPRPRAGARRPSSAKRSPCCICQRSAATAGSAKNGCMRPRASLRAAPSARRRCVSGAAHRCAGRSRRFRVGDPGFAV